LSDAGGKFWTVALKPGAGSVAAGKGAGAPDVTITVGEDDFLALAAGKLNPQQAFMRGKLKLKGNMAIAMKLNTVLDAARKAAPGGAPAAKPAPAAAAAPAPAAAPKAAAPAASAGGVKSGVLFDAIGAAIRSDGAALVAKVGGVIQFNITAGSATPAAIFVLDLKRGSGAMSTGAPAAGAPAADLTITVADDDFVALADGKLNPQTAFMRGKLKIKGNMALAMKLQAVFDAARKLPAAKL